MKRQLCKICQRLRWVSSTGDCSTCRNHKRIPGVIYLLESEQGYYKIGRAKDLQRRLRDYRKYPGKIELRYSFSSPDTTQIEAFLLRRFAPKCIKGEWFALNSQDVNFIKNLPDGTVQL